VSSPVTVEAVRDRRGVREFLRLPYRLYRGTTQWVPPLRAERRAFLDPRRNPFFSHAEVALWLARREGRTVGRISSHLDRRHLATHDDGVAMFGFLDFEDDPEVARALVTRAADWGRERGMAALRGPLSFSQNHECGLLVAGFDTAPVLGMPYTPAYMCELVERCGLTRAMDLLSYRLEREQIAGDTRRLPEKLLRVVERLGRRSPVTLRRLDMRRFSDEIEVTRRLYTEAWKDNWGFVPPTREEYHSLAHDLRPAMVPGLGLIAEVGGEPVGFALSVLDLNQVLAKLGGRLLPLGWLRAARLRNRVRDLRLILFGVVERYRGRGVDAQLILETFRAGLEAGYESLELAWVLETNTPVRRLVEGLGKDYGVGVHRRHRIYEMPI